jgi:hypothetical protein
MDLSAHSKETLTGRPESQYNHGNIKLERERCPGDDYGRSITALSPITGDFLGSGGDEAEHPDTTKRYNFAST